MHDDERDGQTSDRTGAEVPGIDLTAVDPTADPERFDAILASITAVAERELARRRARSSILIQIGRRWRPLLAAAAVLIIASIGALGSRTFDAEATASAAVGVEEAVGVPTSLASWIRDEETPTPAELILTLEVAQ